MGTKRKRPATKAHPASVKSKKRVEPKPTKKYAPKTLAELPTTLTPDILFPVPGDFTVVGKYSKTLVHSQTGRFHISQVLEGGNQYYVWTRTGNLCGHEQHRIKGPLSSVNLATL